jgi:hypothetical protein
MIPPIRTKSIFHISLQCLKVLSNGAGGGGEWYQSINFNKLSCRQVSVFGPKGTPSREEHKTPGRVLTTFSVALTYCFRKIRQNVSPWEHSKY